MTHLSDQQTLWYLPDPDWGHLEVERVSPLVQRVWFHHDRVYDYSLGKPVRTVWGFIKNGKVHTPKDSKTANAKSCCALVDAYKLSGYTSIVPKTTDLTHLL